MSEPKWTPGLYEALENLLAMIAVDDLVPASVSYMQQARAALAEARGEGGE